MAKIIKPPYFESVVNAGEKRLLEFLELNLPDEYFLIPNIEITSTNPRNNRTQVWEYDLIVVAPHAIYNIENKDWKGRIEGDDNYWYINDRQKPNPLKTGRQKTAILASKLKENEFKWGKAWVQNMVTLSYPNSDPPYLLQEAGNLTFELNEELIRYITSPHSVGTVENNIVGIQKKITDFLIGKQNQKSAKEKREVEGYEIIEVLQLETNFTEFLVKPKGVTSSIRKRVKEYSLQVNGLSSKELKHHEEVIKNQYKALHKIKAKPFILNVEFKIDEENHLFYEISDFLDENSLRTEARQRTFTFNEKINIIHNVMAALKEAHKENIFHRDINPDNIYMSSGYAYLGNFGKSYFTDHDEQGYTVMATLNESNTTAYHPLELTVGDASRASDVYSLGVLIYWLFTEKEPIKTPYELDKMGGKLTDDLLPSSVNPALPKWLDGLCHKTILVDDTQRVDSIEELEKTINESLQEEESKSLPPDSQSKKQDNDIDPQELKEGDRIGNEYTIYKVLGRGGYSRVFKVKHGIQGKDYALKLFHESVNVATVIDEYKALVELEHSNIIKFVWNGETPNGQFYTLMEYLEGENLSTYTRTDARLPIHRVYQMATNILSALAEMQSQAKTILHRDIKPQNIIWDNKKRFVLIDFNVASLSEDNKDFVGTNPYLAPDLITENYKVNWDRSADTFALGITLYELVCKQYPWAPQKTPLISKAPNDPRTIEPRLSDLFAEFLLKAIKTNNTQRFQNAQAMLDALNSIGPDNILSEQTIPEESGESIDLAGNDFIDYINSLFSQSKHGNSGTRISADSSKFDQLTYSQTKLDKRLIQDVFDDRFKLLIITGNAGDGKTAFIRKIEEHNNVKDLERYDNKNGARFKINGVVFESNYDGSQDEDGRANDDVLKAFFKPFANIADYHSVKEGRIIAVNEGRLMEFLNTSKDHQHLANIIEEYFYQEASSSLPDGLMIINLNLRSVVASNDTTPSLFRQQIKALTKKALWKKCETCTQTNLCFIKYNLDTFNDNAVGDSIISRMEWLLRTASLKRELHITMRDLRSFIAFTLTRDYCCEDIEGLIQSFENSPEKYWQLFYFNITNPDKSDGGKQDRLIKLLRETDIGEVALPDMDRNLFFGKHLESNYLEFGERKLSLLEQFNNYKIQVPAHEQTPEVIERIKEIQKVFIRHQYFEGKSELIKLQNGGSSNNDEVPSFLLRLPYHSVFKFVNVLNQGDIGDSIKLSISRAISLNEGLDTPSIYNWHLALSSTEIKDPFSKSFRLFELDDFELFVNKTDHLTGYLEYEPDSLLFRHKTEKHIKLTISLDLYEMLYFIQQGFSPSLNDLRGKYVELIIFKNLLENLNYEEVVVTKDNIEFFKISKESNSNLHIQPMEV
jgi:serine/threonine protein kinase